MECNFCSEKQKSWSNLRLHYAVKHKSKPFTFCLCGFVVRSKSVLYKHVADHKLESRKAIKNNPELAAKKQDMKNFNLNVKDLIRYVLLSSFLLKQALSPVSYFLIQIQNLYYKLSVCIKLPVKALQFLLLMYIVN